MGLALGGAVVAFAAFLAGTSGFGGALLGNFLGTVLAPRIPERPFRYMTLCLVFVAGGLSVLTAGGA